MTNYNSEKELLEWELSLSSEDLRAHVWYHGNISRNEAESLLQNDGDFLIRDCSSGRRGDFVLTCRWKKTNLHFLIQQVRNSQRVKPHTIMFDYHSVS